MIWVRKIKENIKTEKKTKQKEDLEHEGFRTAIRKKFLIVKTITNRTE